MLKNMLLALTVATVFAAAAVSASQLNSAPHFNQTCNGPCSNSKPCPTDVMGCTCLSGAGTPNGRGLCTVIGPAAKR
jgi:hypothetical protein